MPSHHPHNDSELGASDLAASVACPQCMTRFRLTPQQLSAAGGLVRCSVCMSIFNAAPANSPAEAEDIPTLSANAENSDELPVDPVESTEQISAGEADSPLDLLAGLSTVNHDFEYHRPSQAPRRWPWLILNLTAILVLAGQIALWQKSALFSSPAGDYLRQLCPLLPSLCEDKPPAAKQLGDVVSTHLLVRKHPSAAKALFVDAILLNRDPSPSPFPALQLRFSDINGHDLASRVFQPNEYLAGELNALSTLASQQPVHIALEIVDPGSAAVNYQLQLLP